MNAALVILCGYGLQALWRGWVEKKSASAAGVTETFRRWWNSAPAADKRWVTASVGATGLAVLGWLIYGSARTQVLHFLGEVGFEGPEAESIARFSHREVGLFALILGVAVSLLIVILTGWLSGARARIAAVSLGTLLTLDLARANAPWIIHYQWKERLATNALFDILRASPQTARVTGHLPFSIPGRAGQLQQSLMSVYGVEWLQHQFRRFDIQSLDLVQMPRKPADLDAYEMAVKPNPLREWELTNTRYLLTLAPLVDPMNQQLDPVQKRFRLHTAFNLSQTPDGVIQVSTNSEGPFGLVEFTGALPRAMLFDRWRGNVDDDEALALLGGTNFSPHAEVLVAGSVPAPSVTTSSQPAGTAVYESYTSRRFVIATDARTPCILLVNDKHDPDWNVFVDGKPEPLLRANFIMRAVYLPPGKHQVEFRFEPSQGTLWFSASAIGASLLLLGYTRWSGSTRPLSK
ncbi:MAG: hypothetical protein AB7J34_21330, partial [Limisphaerales bacterium]